MKKIISNFLTVLMLFGMLSSFSVFAEEKYPPLETGTHTGISEYELETVGDNPSPITLNESSDIQFQVRDNPLPLNDEDLINQIKEDYVVFTSNKYTFDQIDVLYYGTLSDGSMILYMDVPVILQPAFECTVIGKYVYVTPNMHDGMVIYKEHQFKEFVDAYLDGSLTEDLLDELAVKLSFAKFVNPNEQLVTDETTIPSESIETTDPTTVKSTESTNIEETTVEITSTWENTEITATTVVSNISTADTAINKTSNDSIQTGYNNVAIICVIILAISGVIFYIAKYKKV